MMNTEPVRTLHESRSSRFESEEQRIQSFGRALDALREEIERQLGAEDAAHILRVRRASRALEIAGRTLIHFSIEPLSFGLGVTALWAHKSLELMEIGHMALHGCYDTLPEAKGLHAAEFHWKAPIDEAYWHRGHNIRHHQYTNVANRDPDLSFAMLRLSPRIRYRAAHKLQPVSNVLTWFGFGNAINLHVTGMLDHYIGDRRDGAPSEPKPELRKAQKAFVKKFLRYHAREYVFFPALAGPFFLKTLFGNVLSEVGRDLLSAAIIYCGHVGADDYPTATEAGGRAQWYKLQAEGARDVRMPKVLSILCGALDRQIEHHLFPRMPPNRLRDIAPRVKAICEAHGVNYREASWPETLRDVLGNLRELASPRAGAAQLVG